MPYFAHRVINLNQPFEYDGTLFFYATSDVEYLGLQFYTSTVDSYQERIHLRWYDINFSSYVPTKNGIILTSEELLRVLDYSPSSQPYEFTSPNNPDTKFTMSLVKHQGFSKVKVEKTKNELTNTVFVDDDGWDVLMRNKEGLLFLLECRKNMGTKSYYEQLTMAMTIINNIIDGMVTTKPFTFKKPYEETLPKKMEYFTKLGKLVTRLFKFNNYFLVKIHEDIPDIINDFIELLNSGEDKDKLKHKFTDPSVESISNFIIHCIDIE